MKKLINLQVMPAEKLICVWVDDEGKDEHSEWRCGIALKNASRGCIIPRFIIVGTFDDGSVKVAGICRLGHINEPVSDYEDGEYDHLFLYDQFAHYVDGYLARALVNGSIVECESETITEAKATVLSTLIESGVEMSDEAVAYLKDDGDVEDDDLMKEMKAEAGIYEI